MDYTTMQSSNKDLLIVLRDKARKEAWDIEFLRYDDDCEEIDGNGDADSIEEDDEEDDEDKELKRLGRNDMARILLTPVTLTYPSSCAWGAVIFLIAKDFGDLLGCHVKMARLLRSLVGVAVLVGNIVFQFLFLSWTYNYVSQPAVQTTQIAYADYHRQCFHRNGTYSDTLCKGLDSQQRSLLCESAIRHRGFVLGVCALWTLAVLREIRTVIRLARQVYAIPQLPYGIPTGDQVIEVRSEIRQVPTTYILFALTNWTRVALVLFVLLPRTLTALALYYLGLRWLFVTTGLSSLILNSLVLLLIFDIPMIIADGSLPLQMKTQISNFAFGVPDTDAADSAELRLKRIFWDVIRSSFYVAVGVLILWWYVVSGRNDVIPNYNGDLEYMCEALDMHAHLNLCQSMQDCFPYGQELHSLANEL